MSSVKEQARKQANLRLLQRTCSRDIQDIILTATHVVLYEFIEVAWQKSGIEGSLFLTQTPTSYQLIVLNRNSVENFIMQITATIQLQHQDPYIIFRQKLANDTTKIRGVWFHNADERITMFSALEKSIQRLNDYGSPPQPQPPAPVSTTTKPPTPPPPRQPSPAVSAESSVSLDSTALAALLTPAMAGLSVAEQEANTGTINGSVTAAATAARAASSTSPSAQLPGGGVALDKKSLQLALLSLIQDDRFLDLLHSQYLRVVHARAKKQQQNQQTNNHQ